VPFAEAVDVLPADAVDVPPADEVDVPPGADAVDVPPANAVDVPPAEAVDEEPPAGAHEINRELLPGPVVCDAEFIGAEGVAGEAAAAAAEGRARILNARKTTAAEMKEILGVGVYPLKQLSAKEEAIVSKCTAAYSSAYAVTSEIMGEFFERVEPSVRLRLADAIKSGDGCDSDYVSFYTNTDIHTHLDVAFGAGARYVTRPSAMAAGQLRDPFADNYNYDDLISGGKLASLFEADFLAKEVTKVTVKLLEDNEKYLDKLKNEYHITDSLQRNSYSVAHNYEKSVYRCLAVLGRNFLKWSGTELERTVKSRVEGRSNPFQFGGEGSRAATANMRSMFTNVLRGHASSFTLPVFGDDELGGDKWVNVSAKATRRRSGEFHFLFDKIQHRARGGGLSFQVFAAHGVALLRQRDRRVDGAATAGTPARYKYFVGVRHRGELSDLARKREDVKATEAAWLATIKDDEQRELMGLHVKLRRCIALDPGTDPFLMGMTLAGDAEVLDEEWTRQKMRRLSAAARTAEEKADKFHVAAVSDELAPEAREARAKAERMEAVMRRTAADTRARLQRVRDAFHHRVAAYLVQHKDLIIIPRFHTSEMVRKVDKRRKFGPRTAQTLNTLAFHKFIGVLQSAARLAGRDVKVTVVNEPWTSKTCVRCSTINMSLGGSKMFTCVNDKCNLHINRDVNGAANIMIRYLAVAALLPSVAAKVLPLVLPRSQRGDIAPAASGASASTA